MPSHPGPGAGGAGGRRCGPRQPQRPGRAGGRGRGGTRPRVGGKLVGLEVLAALRVETGPVEANDGVRAAL